MRKNLKTFLCLFMSVILLMSTNHSLAWDIEENEYQEMDGIVEPLIEETVEEVSWEDICLESESDTSDENEEIFVEESSTEGITEESDENLLEGITEEPDENLPEGIALLSEEYEAVHTANDLTAVLSTYIEEKQKQVSVFYEGNEKVFTDEAIDIDLSEIGLDNIDNLKMEFSLQYHVIESDTVEPAERYIQGGDYFYVNIPKYMAPNFEAGNCIDLEVEQDGEIIKVATAEIVSLDGEYKIKITFTDAVGKNDNKELFNINFGCKFWLTFVKEQLQDDSQKNEVIDISGIDINIKYPEKTVSDPSKIEKTGQYIKEDGKILWTIAIDKDSVGRELQGWTLTDEIDTSNQTLSAIYIKSENDADKTKIYDVDNVQDYPGLTVYDESKFSYSFSNNEKTPYYIYVETKEKEEEILKPAFKTWSPTIKFTNKIASLSSEEKDSIEKENVQVFIKGGNIFNKWDYVENANCIRWQIPVNDGLYHISKPVKVVDHMVKNLELIESKGVTVAGKTIVQKNEGDQFAEGEDAYYTITDRLDANGEIEGKDLTVYYKAGALDGKSGGIKFYTRVIYAEELYEQGYQFISNTADLVIEEYNLKTSATAQVKCKDVIGIPNDTGLAKYFVNKWGKFVHEDNTMFWSFQPTMSGGVVKDVKIYDVLDDKQTFIEDSLKIYVGSGAYLPFNPADRGIKVKIENNILEIDFSESDITIEEFNTLRVTYSTNTDFGSNGSIEKKSEKKEPVEKYTNRVIIYDGKNAVGKDCSINVDSRMLQKDTATYYDNDEIGFCYKISVNPNKATIFGGVDIEDKISDIKYAYYDSKNESKLIDINELKDKAEFAVSKVNIYQDGKEVEGVTYESKEGNIKLHLSPELVSKHEIEIKIFVKLVNADAFFKQNISVRPENTVNAKVQMKDGSDEYTDFVYTDDSDVRLTQKKLEKKFEKQYVDTTDKETYIDYSLIINSAAVMLGDVKLKDTLNSSYTEFDIDSVKLYKLSHDSTDAVIGSNEIAEFRKQLDVNSSGEQQLIIEIDNCKDTYKLVYRVKILPEQKENSTLVNNAVLEGKSISGDVSDSSKVTIQLGKSGWANATTRAVVKINKSDEDTNKALQGVVFALYRADDKTNPISVKATDVNGSAQFYVDFSTEYVIVETQALEGYVADMKEYKIAATDLVKGVNTYKVLNITNKKEPGTEVPSQEPSTETPSEVPSTETPSEVPSTETPSEVPSTEAPSEVPSTETPSEVPSTEAPSEVPSTEAPSEVPSTEAPSEVPSTEAPSQEPSSETIIVDDNTPTNNTPTNNTPTNSTPNKQDPDTTINEDEVPLAPGLPENQDVFVELEDDDVPLAGGPKTGDNSNIVVWFWIMLLSFLVFGVSTTIIDDKKTE